MENKEKVFQKYRKLVGQIDQATQRLEEMHRSHMVCRKGCSACCMDYKIFPIEFFSILKNIRGKEIQIAPDAGDGDCVFLVDHACAIYEWRPIICRTHGLPLLYTNDEGEWELSACELNFTEFDEEFHTDNTFPQDKTNSRLFMLNKELVALPEFSEYGEFDLLRIRDLIERMSSFPKTNATRG